MTANRIDLDAIDRYDELMAAGSGIKPGHMLEMIAAGTVQALTTPGSFHEYMVAKEEALRGLTIEDAYTSGEPVRFFYPYRGQRWLGRLQLGQNVAKGDLLMPAGDGTLFKFPTNGGLLYNTVASSTAVTNSVSTIQAYDTQYTIPANFLKAGDIIHVRAAVRVPTTAGTDTTTFTLKIGSTTFFVSAAINASDADVAVIDAYLYVRTVGASGTFTASGLASNGVISTATASAAAGYVLGSTAIDTTAAKIITANVTYSATTSTVTSTLDELSVELIRAGGLKVAARALEAIDASSAEAFIRVRAA